MDQPSMDQQALEKLLHEQASYIPPLEDASFGSKFDDFGKYKVVLMGNGTHGTHEFYEARAKITQYLIEKHGFNIVAIEADWPDAEIIDRHVRRRPGPKVKPEMAFDRFPRWMWRNQEVHTFVEWLRDYNKDLGKKQQVGFYGLDLYSLDRSMEAVIQHLSHTDPKMAQLARQRYGKVQPWIPHMDESPDSLRAMVASTLPEVMAMVKDLLEKRLDEAKGAEDSEAFHSSEQNARLVAGTSSTHFDFLKKKKKKKKLTFLPSN
jgi:erythromycin esterase-like protein